MPTGSDTNAEGLQLYIKRAALDSTLTLPFILVKNRIQFGHPLVKHHVITYSASYALATFSGYWFSRTTDVSATIAAGMSSCVSELVTRPLLSGHSMIPSRMTLLFLMSRECCYWKGVASSNKYIQERESTKAILTQTFYAGVVASISDVYMAKSIVYNWQTIGEVKRWMCRNTVDFAKLMVLSCIMRSASTVAIPLFVMKSIQ